MIWLAWAGVITSISTLGLIVIGTIVAARRWRLPVVAGTFAEPPVSILKPMRGADSGLRDNLESFFHLDYPEYELLFCVADANDPAAQIAREVMKNHPTADAKLMIGEIRLGTNPKINNIARAYELAKHDLILISDSNVRVEPGDLSHWVSYFSDDNVGVVTAIVAGTDPSNWAGRLESVYLNTFYARFMYVAEMMGNPAVVGKAMLMSRQKAAGFGGIKALANYLAEDYMAGVAFVKMGFRVALSGHPVRQHIGKHTYQTYWSRHVRWGRIRKASNPLTFWAEPFTGVLFVALFFYVSLRGAASPGIANAGVATLFAVWFASDFYMIRMIQGRLTARTIVSYFARELTAPFLWLHAALGSRVLWRGRYMKIQPGGLLEE